MGVGDLLLLGAFGLMKGYSIQHLLTIIDALLGLLLQATGNTAVMVNWLVFRTWAPRFTGDLPLTRTSGGLPMTQSKCSLHHYTVNLALYGVRLR